MLETSDDLEAFFLRDLSPRQRCELFRTMIEYYKETPSADRARLLTALKNKQAEMVAGVSSKTMARARNPDSNIRSAGKRRRLTQGGLSKEEVEQIAFEACMDSRFCEVRSWIERSAQSESRRWECVGLVPIFTMWETLCKTHGKFCSYDFFCKSIPDFYVAKKKERCVCSHCKAGRRALDDIVVVVNALRRSAPKESRLKEDLDDIRVDLITYRGHLDKEIVIEIADGSHKPDGDDCNACALLSTIGDRLGECLDTITTEQFPIQISPENWSVVFPGKELPQDRASRLQLFMDWIPTWRSKVQKLVDHLLLKADRIKALERDIEALLCNRNDGGVVG